MRAEDVDFECLTRAETATSDAARGQSCPGHPRHGTAWYHPRHGRYHPRHGTASESVRHGIPTHVAVDACRKPSVDSASSGSRRERPALFTSATSRTLREEASVLHRRRTLWIFWCHWDILQVSVPTRLKRSTPARIDESSATSMMRGTQRGHSETSPPASRSVLTVPNTVKPRPDKPTAACRPIPEEQPVIKTAPASCTRNVCRSTTQSKAETNNTTADRRSKERIRSRGRRSYFKMERIPNKASKKKPAP